MNVADRGRDLTVGVVTHNRPASLARCLASLALLQDRLREVIVVDDTSDLPLADVLAHAPASIADRLTLIKQTAHEGYIVARNTMMRRSSTEYVLLMDDDAYLIEGDGILEALGILDRHSEVAAIACAQAEADGSPWPPAMQPSPVFYRCRVPAYIGFAHILRRRAFFEVGGYREDLRCFGEEKDLCARFMHAGYEVVYLPDVLVAHVMDPAGRSQTRYLRYVVRNDCLFALYNEPWPVWFVSLPVRLLRYFSMHRPHPFHDLSGFFWILAQLFRSVPRVARNRTPISWSEFRDWHRLRPHPPAWHQRTFAIDSPADTSRITVGIPTRDRAASLAKGLAALGVIADRVASIIVVDDASAFPVDPMTAGMPPELLDKLHIIRQREPIGNIAARNLIMRTARTDYVLLCDDDAYLTDARTIEDGLAIMQGDRRVAAVGFAMAETDGTLWPRALQASPASQVCIVPSYIGFAHLIRRTAFLEVGGYRALFWRHGEEKECCLRLIDAGYDIVYLPDPPVVHLNDPVGRNAARYLRFMTRNDCFGAMLNQPLPIALIVVPHRLVRYLRMCLAGRVRDSWGLFWIVGQLWEHLPAIVRERRPVKWSTVRRWRQLRRSSLPYDGATRHTPVAPGVMTR
jgi:GT2 family glycosyltransferase